MIRVNNLYRHADGGLYCLLSDDMPGKVGNPGEWEDGVAYLADDGRMRWTDGHRWLHRFAPVAEIAETDLTEAQMAMIRRANPGDVDLDFRSAMESWHEAEIGVQSNMLELAIAAAIQKYEWPGHLVDAPARLGPDGNPDSVEITIRSSDLRAVLETYEIERVPLEDGFTIRLTKQ